MQNARTVTGFGPSVLAAAMLAVRGVDDPLLIVMVSPVPFGLSQARVLPPSHDALDVGLLL
jgi:hypothetical protein